MASYDLEPSPPPASSLHPGSFYPPSAQPAPYGYAPAAATAKPPPTQAIAIVSLLLNILIWPGLGTIVHGDMLGWLQGFLFLFGLILTITIIGLFLGIPMMIGAWIWALVASIQALQKATKA